MVEQKGADLMALERQLRMMNYELLGKDVATARLCN